MVARSVIVLAISPGTRTWSTLWTVLAAIGIGGYGGAVGGVSYHLVRARLKRFGRAGNYLTGIAVAYAYLLAFALPAAFLGVEATLREPAGWVILAIMGAVFGLFMGHWWFREPKSVSSPVKQTVDS